MPKNEPECMYVAADCYRTREIRYDIEHSTDRGDAVKVLDAESFFQLPRLGSHWCGKGIWS